MSGMVILTLLELTGYALPVSYTHLASVFRQELRRNWTRSWDRT